MATPDHKTDSSGAPLLLWDCGSALYDSYELTAFKRQLDAAVLASVGRSLSMPHLPAAGVATTPPPEDVQQRQQALAGRRRRRRLPALLRRLFSKMLRPVRLFPAAARRHARYLAADDGVGSRWSGALTSIPEEQSASSPEMGSSPGPSALRKAQSERFIGSKTASSMVQFEVIL